MDVKSEYKLTIALLVSMRVFRCFFTDALSGPDRTMTGGAATAGSAFLFMVLTLKTNFSNNKGISQFAIFETTFSYRSAQGNFPLLLWRNHSGRPDAPGDAEPHGT